MPDYNAVSKQLGRVRRAWKRTAGLSGLVIVLVEALGMFTFVLVVDVLYRPGLGGRLVLLVAAAAAVVYLVARHVIRPIVRRIPDRQMALYVEERNPEFEGALISAAEFGPVGGVSEEQQTIVDAIITEAVARARRFGLRSAVDLSRLRKYGIAAALAILVYLVIGLLAPKAMARHAARVLTPWRVQTEAAPGPREAEYLGPITFVLSSYDTRLLRGSPFELEAQASRASPAPVLFHFRPLAEVAGSPEGEAEPPPMPAVPVLGEEGAEGSAWRTLVMKEIEKLHGYKIALPDVNEDIAFFVSTGEFGSDVHRIEVYDPLRLEGFEIGVAFPEYLRMADEISELPTGDVSVPEGSTVTVRILTNGQLEGGELLWADGEEQRLAVSDGRTKTAAASLEVSRDRSYNFTVRDIDGQVLSSTAPSLVHAIKDTPPTLQVLAPRIDVVAHPLAEVAFRVEAKDDWNVASVEYVYRRGIEQGVRPVRIPLELAARGPTGQRAMTTVEAGHDMLFETFEPPLEPGDLITYHFEVHDRKGHVAMSDIFFITVMAFEVWGTWLPLYEEGAGEMAYVPAAVQRYVAAAWHLHLQKDSLSREEYEKACQKLADEFVSGGVTLWDYVREPP